MQGIKDYIKSNPTKTDQITHVGFCDTQHLNHINEGSEPFVSDTVKLRAATAAGAPSEAGVASEDPYASESQKATLRFPFGEPVSFTELGVPLNQPVQRQIVYPWLKTMDVFDPCYLATGHLNDYFGTPGKKKEVLAGLLLNPYLTHLIIGPNRITAQTNELLESIVPSIYIVFAGKSRFGMQYAIEKAHRGQVILMKNTGLWVNALVRKVYSQMEKQSFQYKDRQEVLRRFAMKHYLTFELLGLQTTSFGVTLYIC